MGYSHGKKWTKDEVVQAIKLVVDSQKMNTMPTHSELNRYYSSCSVSLAVSRHGGTRYFAQLLGLDIKPSETKFGEDVEDLCASEIENQVLKGRCEQ